MSSHAAKIQSCQTKTSKIIADLREFEATSSGAAALNAKKALKCFENGAKFLTYVRDELQFAKTSSSVDKPKKTAFSLKLSAALLDSAQLNDVKVNDLLAKTGIKGVSALTLPTREKVDLIEAESQEDETMTMDNTVMASEKPVPSAAEFCSTAQKAKKNIDEMEPCVLSPISNLQWSLDSDKTATPLESPVRETRSTVLQKSLQKTVSSPALSVRATRAAKREFNMTPVQREEKRLKKALSTNDMSKNKLRNKEKAPPLSKPAPKTRLRSPSPSQSSLFRSKESTSIYIGTTRSLFSSQDSPMRPKAREADAKEKFENKKKQETERIKKKQEEQKEAREKRKKEKDAKMQRAKERREEEEKRRKEELMKKQQKENKKAIPSLKAIRNAQKTKPEPASSSEEPMSTDSVPDKARLVPEEASMNATFVVTKPTKLPTPSVKTSELPSSSVRDSFPPTTTESYQMTPRNTDKSTANKTADDYGIDDLSSGDETDDDENPRKKIPGWAHKSEVMQRLKTQYWEVTPIAEIFGSAYADSNRLVDFKELLGKQLKHRPQRLDRINQRRETSVWNSPMRNPAPVLDRTLNLDQSCMPFDKPTPL